MTITPDPVQAIYNRMVREARPILFDLSPEDFTFTPEDMISATVMIEGGAGGTTKVFGQGVDGLAENLAEVTPK